MARIFYTVRTTSDPWHSKVLEYLPKGNELIYYSRDRPYEEQVGEAEIVIDDGTVQIDKKVVDSMKHVRFIQRYGTGMDHIDIGYVLKRGIILSNTPGQFSGFALAEHAILLMLSLAKQTREWVPMIERRASGPTGDELRGKTIGLVGLGASGGELAKRAKALEMRVLAVDLRPLEPSRLEELGVDFFGGPESLEGILAESDYVSIHVPLTKTTRGMIGRKELARMKRSARLINVARGPIVDEAALIEALRAGTIAGAGLDVVENEPLDPQSPLMQMPNVVVSPHIAGTTVETADRRARVVGENVSRYLRGLPPLYQVTPE